MIRRHVSAGLLSLLFSVPAVAAAGDGADAADGAALYARYCALCHGEDREGHAADHAPSLKSPELMGKADPSFLWTAIGYGRPGTAMAAFSKEQGGPLSHDEQHVLFDWLMAQSGVENEPLEDLRVEGNVGAGATVYAEHCASCHGDKGEGGAGTALGNPVFLATASDAFIRHTVREGRTGTPMPGFGDTLTDAEIGDVVAFLRSRALGWDAPPPMRVQPPDPSAAILNPKAEPARLDQRKRRFVSAASVRDALSRGERMVLLDARPLSDWHRSHIPGALPVPFYDGVAGIVEHLPDDRTPIVVYCACPHAASGKVVDALKAEGFRGARILDEGILHWAAQGFPLALGEPR